MPALPLCPPDCVMFYSKVGKYLVIFLYPHLFLNTEHHPPQYAYRIRIHLFSSGQGWGGKIVDVISCDCVKRCLRSLGCVQFPVKSQGTLTPADLSEYKSTQSIELDIIEWNIEYAIHLQNLLWQALRLQDIRPVPQLEFCSSQQSSGNKFHVHQCQAQKTLEI